MLEPIAGRVELGQTPEQAAHREAQEEARLELGTLHLVANYYPSPGAITEYLTCYVGIADLPDESACVAGLAEEQEDIASSLMSFETLMTLADSSALDTGPLFISALWLARHRDRLRAQIS
jgi:ADP-ribose pyrophosphatase YjhB (NUDIX family)